MDTKQTKKNRPETSTRKNPRRSAANRDVFDIDDAVTFQLTVLSSLIGRPFYSMVGRFTGISIIDWRLMVAVASKPGMTQAEIAYATGVHKMTVSRTLRALAKYVAIEPHPTDNRKRVAYLTDEGRGIYDKYIHVNRCRLEMLMRELAPSEQRLFKAMLFKLIAGARQWADDESPPDAGYQSVRPVRR